MPDAPATTSSLIVTGGSSGIGAALCRLAAARNWRVWIGYGDGAERARMLAEELAAHGCSARPVALPLADPEELRDAIAHIAHQDDAVSALALCAAPAPDVAPLLKLTPGHFRRQYETAVIGNHVLLTETWRRCFRARGGGQVVAVLSAAQGPPAAPHMAAYIAAKYGLEGLLNAAAAEFGRGGLRIGLVRPSYVETPMLEAFEPLLLERARAAQSFLRPETVAQALLRGLTHPGAAGAVAELPLDSNAVLERVS